VYAGAADYSGTSTLGYSFGYGASSDLSSFYATLPIATVQKFRKGLEGGDWTSLNGLDGFIAGGRKLIMAHGLSDSALNANNTVRYYRSLAGAKGGYGELQKNVRLFLAPGVQHCGYGPGPDGFLKLYNTPGWFLSPDVPFDSQHDALAALIAWVENGTPPKSIVATKYADEAETSVVRTLPLCPFPAEAAYKGTGSIDEATNWTCPETDTRMLNIGLTGVRAGM
jgi:feruloyl esterase